MSSFLKERFSECSDGFDPPVLRATRSQKSTPSGRVPLPIVPTTSTSARSVPLRFQADEPRGGAMGVGLSLKSNHVAAKYVASSQNTPKKG
jgi:hypothetical protein